MKKRLYSKCLEMQLFKVDTPFIFCTPVCLLEFLVRRTEAVSKALCLGVERCKRG